MNRIQIGVPLANVKFNLMTFLLLGSPIDIQCGSRHALVGRKSIAPRRFCLLAIRWPVIVSTEWIQSWVQ